MRKIAGKRKDVKIWQFLLLLGIGLIILYFIIIFTIRGPHIRTYSEVERDETGGSTMEIWMPIWIVFIFLGDGALFLGFLVKFLEVLPNPHQKFDILFYCGFILTLANLFFLFYYYLSWFKGIYIELLEFPGVIIFILAVFISALYLVNYFIKKPIDS